MVFQAQIGVPKNPAEIITGGTLVYLVIKHQEQKIREKRCREKHNKGSNVQTIEVQSNYLNFEARLSKAISRNWFFLVKFPIIYNILKLNKLLTEVNY